MLIWWVLPIAAHAAEEPIMQTYQDQLDFFNRQWPELKTAVETGGPGAVISLINARSDELERRVLYMFSRQGLVMGDAAVAVADAGIAEFLRQAEAAGDEATRDKRTDGANVISYNLSADLADCWPGDDAVRERHHFERGLKAAQDCITWREQLGKPAGPLSMAWWARGMHELSLGRHQDAVASLSTSLAFAKTAAADQQLPPTVGADGDFSVILGSGYVGLARLCAGDESGRAQYDEAIAAFTVQLGIDGRKEDAQFGIDQLKTVHSRYVK